MRWSTQRQIVVRIDPVAHERDFEQLAIEPAMAAMGDTPDITIAIKNLAPLGQSRDFGTMHHIAPLAATPCQRPHVSGSSLVGIRLYASDSSRIVGVV